MQFILHWTICKDTYTKAFDSIDKLKHFVVKDIEEDLSHLKQISETDFVLDIGF